jgi:hypothetical protein
MFLRYLQSIKPTSKGTLAILVIVFIVPVIVDLISLPFIEDSSFSLFRFVISNYFVLIPVLIIYLLVFYILYAGWKATSTKVNHQEEVKSFEFEKTDQ